MDFLEKIFSFFVPSLEAPSVLEFHFNFWISATVLLLTLLGGVIFFYERFRHKNKDKFILYWGTGLLLVCWYKLPEILAYLGFRFQLTEFDMFYSMTLILAFLGIMLMDMGVMEASNYKYKRMAKRNLIAWGIFSGFLLIAYFWKKEIMSAVLPLWLVIAIIYIPIQLSFSISILVWARKKEYFKDRLARVGLRILSFAAVFQLFIAAVYIWAFNLYEPEFWFVAIVSSKGIPIYQAVNILIFFVGFMFLHRYYFKLNSGNQN